MASSSTQHTQEYQKAVAAYVQGNYEEAAKITDQLVGTRRAIPTYGCCGGTFTAVNNATARLKSSTMRFSMPQRIQN